ncbi:hypothetical protein [Kutzneria sp. CA-103260]|uniref:hypothetical protein n=1 Tax=Kutzneria sp. CA-103260 TaxID=2802641 RepID=UPI001BADC371|nr:hypothetical protein [Kutzneria sp. CA-103260]QUQ67607.1 hypothetical protein JJ691_53420 [Kutzneria sp. CA-103260]
MRKVLGLAAAAALLSACSTATPPPSQVASLDGGSTAATTTSAAPTTDRPYIRLDATQDEINQLLKGWYACLKDQGHKMIVVRGSPDFQSNTPADKAAVAACENKHPYGPDEMDPKKNPHFYDDYHVYMKCLPEHGLMVHAIDPFGTGWTFDDGVTQKLSNDQMTKVEQDCQIQAFGKH